MGRFLSLLLLAGCSSAYAAGPVSDDGGAVMLQETVWTGIKDMQATGTTTGLYQRCYENADCASLCCVGRPICETCAPFAEAVCVPAKLCQGG